MTETVEFRQLPVPGATMLSVRESTRLWTYVHEKYCVTCVVSGTGRWRMRGAEHDICPSSLMVMAPGDVHVTTAVTSSASFDAIFLDSDLVEGLFADSFRGGRPFALDASQRDPGALGAFEVLRRGLAEPDPLAATERLTRGMAALFEASNPSGLVLGPGCEHRVQQVREVIADSYQREPFARIDIGAVARELAVDYFWLFRRFREHFGLSPYQYAKHLRAARARELLMRGPSQEVPTLQFVASRAGFYDYGHMIRDLKSCLGVSPAAVARQMGGWRPRKPPSDAPPR